MQNQQGQTLIEIIVAIGLIVLVMTTLVGGVTLAVRNNRFAKDRALSKEYVRQTQEWLRSQRDQVGWDTFASILRSDGTTFSYCLPTLPQTPQELQTVVPTTGGCGVISGTQFVRTVALVLTGNPVTQVDATVTVAWQDGGKNFSSSSRLTLYRWQ